MSDGAPGMTAMEVYEDPDDEEDDADARRIGRVQLGGDGRLAVLDSAADRDAFLRDVVDQVNRKPQLGLRDPGPLGSGERFEIGAVAVPRGAAEFLPALRAYLLTYYGLRLV